MKLNLSYGTVVFVVLIACSLVYSASPARYFSSVDTVASAKGSIEARRHLLNALKKLFTNSDDVRKPEETSLITYKGNCFHVLPSVIIYLIEKYLEPKDVLNFSLLTHEMTDVVLNDAVNFNLSAFCPHFVLPDNLLNRIFYLSLIKKLGVDSITDEKISDAIQLMTLKRVNNDLPVPKNISRAVFDQMFMCFFEAVNGLNSRVPLSKNTQRLYFSEKYNHHDLTKTRKYIKDRIGDEAYQMEIMDFIKQDPTEAEFMDVMKNEKVENVSLRIAGAEFQKFATERLFKTISVEYCSQVLLDLIKKGHFNFELFDKIDLIRDRCTLREISENIRSSSNLKAVSAFNFKFHNVHYLKSNVYYAVTRTAIDPLDYGRFSSIEGEICKTTFKIILNDQSTNLTLIDTISQMIRYGHIDLTSLTALHRSFVLNGVLTCPNSDLLNIILNELPGSLNLMEMPVSENNETSYSPISLANASEKSLELVFNHLRSKSDDPLPLLFYSQDDLKKIGPETIRDKFDLNKKYLFDYDFDLFKVPLFFMRNMSEEQVLELKGTVMDFKTIVERMSILTPGIKSYFTSNTEIFNELTTLNVNPISLKRYFEYVVFEEIDVELTE